MSLPEQHHRVHHGVPITSEIISDLRHRPAMLADLACRPPRCPRRQRRSCRRDHRVLFAPRRHRTRPVRATPSLLAPHQPCRAAEHRQINQQHLALAVIPRRRPAPGTVRTRRPRLDLDPQPRRPLTNPTNRHGGQANKQRAHARRIGFQQGLLDTGRRRTPSALLSPCPAPGTPLHPLDPTRPQSDRRPHANQSLVDPLCQSRLCQRAIACNSGAVIEKRASIVGQLSAVREIVRQLWVMPQSRELS